LRGFGAVYRGLESGGRRTARTKSRAVVELGRDRLGLRVGDGSDRRDPPGSDAGARGRPVSDCGRGEVCARLAGPALRGPEVGAGLCYVKERGEKGEIGRPRGRKGLGQARDREGEEKSFSILFFQLLLKPFEKNL